MVQYNGIQIPFAYPPLGFYAAAWISNLFHLPTIDVLRWLPALVTIGTLPAFFALGRVVFDSAFKAAVATLFYALTPRAFAWLIMGGGLTRSFGQLFLILDAYFIYLLFTTHTRKNLAGAVLTSTLVTLSHPEAAVQATGMGLLLWLFFGRNKRATVDAGLVGLGTLLATGLWWLPLLLRFGLDPFLSAAMTGQHSPFAVLIPLIANLTGEPMVTFGAVFALLGAAIQISRGNYFLVTWMPAAFLFDPRGAWTVAMVPAALLAGAAVCEFIAPALNAVIEGAPDNGKADAGKRFVFPAFLIFVTLYMLAGAVNSGEQITKKTVSENDRAAFEWISSNTPPDSRFIMITGNPDMFSDGTQEWFPVLANRTSLTTVQGREWLDGEVFEKLIRDFQDIQNCAFSKTPASCITEQTALAQPAYDYVYITRVRADTPEASELLTARLIAEFKRNQGHRLVYESNDIAIFERSPNQ